MQSLSVKIAKPRKAHSSILNYGIIFGFISLIGVIAGTLIVRTDFSSNTYLSELLQTFITSHKNGSFFQVLSFSFLSAFLLIILIEVCSFCCVGFVIIPVLPLLKGLFCGCLTGYLYMQLGIKGAFINILIFWLPQVAQLVSIIYLSAVGADVSIALFNNTFISPKQGITTKYKRSIKSFVFTGMMLLFTAIIEGALSSVFSFAL